MKFRGISWMAAVLGLAVAVAAAGVAQAEVPKKLQKAFRGKILVTEAELPADAGGVEETIKLYRQKSKSEVAHSMQGGVATWDFHFLVFMKRKPQARQVSLDFYTDDRKKLFVANKRFTGVDPSLKLLKGDIQITEDDGLKRGTDYIVKLSAEVNGREVILAATKLKAK